MAIPQSLLQFSISCKRHLCAMQNLRIDFVVIRNVAANIFEFVHRIQDFTIHGHNWLCVVLTVSVIWSRLIKQFCFRILICSPKALLISENLEIIS